MFSKNIAKYICAIFVLFYLGVNLFIYENLIIAKIIKIMSEDMPIGVLAQVQSFYFAIISALILLLLIVLIFTMFVFIYIHKSK